MRIKYWMSGHSFLCNLSHQFETVIIGEWFNLNYDWHCFCKRR